MREIYNILEGRHPLLQLLVIVFNIKKKLKLFLISLLSFEINIYLEFLFTMANTLYFSIKVRKCFLSKKIVFWSKCTKINLPKNYPYILLFRLRLLQHLLFEIEHPVQSRYISLYIK